MSVRSDGTDLRQLTDGNNIDAGDGWLSVSPDGTKILFDRFTYDDNSYSSYPYDGFGILEMNWDGSGLHRIIMGPGFTKDPLWSPDGRHIAFTSFDVNFDSHDNYYIVPNIYITDGNGHNPVQVTTSGDTRTYTWSPDSTRLAFNMGPTDQSGALYVYTLKTARTIQLTQRTDLYAPSWSHDGLRIAVTTAKGIATLSSDGMDVSELPLSNAKLERFPWSPDGSYLALETHNCGADCSSDLYLIRSNLTGLQVVTQGGRSFAATWSSTGVLVYSRGQVTEHHMGIGAVHTDGSHKATLATGEDAYPLIDNVR